MLKTGNNQINTKVYWNHIYNTIGKEDDYWKKTSRFFTALKYVKDGDKVLDVGCGVGVFCKMVRDEKKECEIWGTDISDDVIRDNGKQEGIIYKQGYAGHQKFLPDNYFDVVFAGEILEHMDNPALLFEEAYRVLKKGGYFIVTTPLNTAVTSPEHMWIFDKDDIETLFFSEGFKKIEYVDLPDMEHAYIIFAVGTK